MKAEITAKLPWVFLATSESLHFLLIDQLEADLFSRKVCLYGEKGFSRHPVVSCLQKERVTDR